MPMNVHNFNAAGAAVDVGIGGDDDGGAPPSIPGMRVYKDEEIAEALIKAPTKEELAARGLENGYDVPKGSKAPKGKAAAAPKPSKAQDGIVSDRRRCLELAAATGETDPGAVIEIAQRYAAFLEGGE